VHNGLPVLCLETQAQRRDDLYGVGRGAGVGRGLGVGEHLPVHGVGVGVGLGVAVGVGVGLGDPAGPYVKPTAARDRDRPPLVKADAAAGEAMANWSARRLAVRCFALVRFLKKVKRQHAP
jgi:hypothetical protein